MRILVVACVLATCNAFMLSTQRNARSVEMMVTKPQLKGAKKAHRCRPKKHAPSDINRTPPTYNVEPQYFDGRPPEYTVISEGADDFDKKAHIIMISARASSARGLDVFGVLLERERRHRVLKVRRRECVMRRE